MSLISDARNSTLRIEPTKAQHFGLWGRLLLATCCLANLMLGCPTRAAEPATQSASVQVAADSDQIDQPILQADATWAGAAIIIISGLFLAAASIGPIVRVNMPPEPPPLNSGGASRREQFAQELRGGQF